MILSLSVPVESLYYLGVAERFDQTSRDYVFEFEKDLYDDPFRPYKNFALGHLLDKYFL